MGSEGISSSRGPEEVLLHSLPWRWDFNAVVYKNKVKVSIYPHIH